MTTSMLPWFFFALSSFCRTVRYSFSINCWRASCKLTHLLTSTGAFSAEKVSRSTQVVYYWTNNLCPTVSQKQTKLLKYLLCSRVTFLYSSCHTNIRSTSWQWVCIHYIYNFVNKHILSCVYIITFVSLQRYTSMETQKAAQWNYIYLS